MHTPKKHFEYCACRNNIIIIHVKIAAKTNKKPWCELFDTNFLVRFIIFFSGMVKVVKMSSNNAGGCLEKILADVSKQSATKQILIGAASGW